MISCRECMERLKPDDPRVRSGRYRLCGCDYCNKPSYYRELEEGLEIPMEPKTTVVIHRSAAKETQQIGLLRKNLIQYIDEKLKERSAKKTERYTIK